jgi:signal transduction histidine kinase
VDSELLTNTNKISLAYGQKKLTIEYSSITFKNVADIRYQYKLEGADNEWSVLSERGFVEYASLNPGNYTFYVRAAMVGAEDEVGEETSLSFHIQPAFYQTVWFYSLIFIVIASLLYTFYRYRMRHVLKMERLRMGIASDLHDEIGSTMSGISMISDMASRKDKDSELGKVLSKISKNSRETLNSMDDIIWSVKPQNDSLSSLTVRLREYAISICELKNISFNMHMDEAINSMKLGMEERRSIYLIVKESINNAVKHSGCSQLSVTFTITHKLLDITIVDNGCGFDPTVRGTRNGVTNMERRAKQARLEFKIKSEKNNGTFISLKTKNHIFI